MHRSHRILTILATLWLAALASAQATPQLTLATVLERGADLVGSSPQLLWRGDGHEATLIIDGWHGQGLHTLDSGLPSMDPLVTSKQIWDLLQEAEGNQPPRFPPISWHDHDTLRIVHDHAVWRWRLGDDQATRVLPWQAPDRNPAAREPMLSLAPGDGHAAVRKNDQLWLFGRDGEAHQLTFDGSEDIIIGGAAHRAEFGITTGMFWSADGRYLAFTCEDQRPIARYPFQNAVSMPPSPRHGRYPMAGQKHSRVEVRVCDTANYEVVALESDPAQDLYWTNIAFAPNGNVVVALVNRGQDHVELARFDQHSGKRTATLLKEHDQQWVEPEHPPTFLASGQFLWWSSQSGYRHLYLHDQDGKLVRQITRGDFDVQSMLHVNEAKGQVWFQASGRDPRQLHLFQAGVHLDWQKRVTRERGTHRAKMSPDGKQALITWSNIETQPGSSIVDLESGTVTLVPTPEPLLATYDLPTQHFYELANDNRDVLYGHIIQPPNMEPGKLYPVIHYVYGGPHAQLVKDQWLGGASLWLTALAAEGFVISRLDNRGTPNRGIEFEQSIHRHLGTLEARDQLLAIELLKRKNFVDPDRIGITGWSFGGYMTLRMMLLHPETFACGISGAPVTDWAMYETGYTERYMDSPQENPAGYAASSCLPLAGKLQRPLLLVHGTDDRTVMWSHSLSFVDRCIDAGVDLDYFPYPQQRHGLRGKDRKHFLNKLRTFFIQHLMPEQH